MSYQANYCVFILTIVTILVSFNLAACEPDSTNGVNQDSNGSDFGSPKRHYLIAPRIGRSPAGSAAIWSALEEATLNSPGQIQPNRGYPNPMRSSLLFLVGNRRLIGPRSGGLLPQARIGRRAAPTGLMPQPRVGRRSDPQAVLEDQEDFGGQQEIAVATLSDSSVSDAIESLVNG